MTYHNFGGETMALHPKQFGIVLKNARMDKKLTQAELAETLNISLSYLKDLERFRNSPSYEVFEKVICYFNLSADTVIYPNQNQSNGAYQKIKRLLTRCDEKQLNVILATTEALLSTNEENSESE
jgi:transcriptional regulator with XRE-family HTH domain